MADNTQLNAGTGGDIIASDDISGVKHQRVKIQHGADGSATDVSTASPLPAHEYGTQPDATEIALKADGKAFQTESTLTAGSSYTSSWFDTDGWETIQIFVASDVISAHHGIEVDFTDDNSGTPTVQAKEYFEFSQADVDRGFVTFNVRTLLQAFRVVYTNGGTNQSSFLLHVDLKVQPDPFHINDHGAQVLGDFGLEVAEGKFSGHRSWEAFGRNGDVDTTTDPEDVWSAGGDYTGHPQSTSAVTAEVVSSNTNDTSAGTGVRTVRVHYLATATSTLIETEDVTMNGTTAVTMTATLYRVVYMESLTFGSQGKNAGNIDVRDNAIPANIYERIGASGGVSSSAQYTVPASQTGYINHISIHLGRASGAAGYAIVSLRVRPFGAGGGDTTGYNAVRQFDVTDSSYIEEHLQSPIIVPEKSDIKVRVDYVSDNNTAINAAFELIMVDDPE